MTRRSQRYQEEGSFDRPKKQRVPKSSKMKVHKIDGFDLAKFIPLTLNQNKMLEDFDEGFNVVATGSAGTGKAQPLYSKVLTVEGWKKMGDITLDDYVITPTNDHAKVIGVYPQGEKEIYRIYFSDGTFTDCCDDHLWKCNIPYDYYRSKKSTEKIVDTKFIRYWLDEKNSNPKYRANISIPLTQPIITPEVSLSIPPYILGVLLGDGSLGKYSIGISNTDECILNKVRSLLDENYSLVVNGKYDYLITRKNKKELYNSYLSRIKNMGLYNKKSFDKFIPDEYINSSVYQRMELLRGLLDTDGTAGKKGDISFSTTSHQLAIQVQYLVLSLGGKSGIKIKNPTYTYKGIKKEGRTAYNVSISLRNPKECFYSTKKLKRVSEHYQERQLVKQITKVERIGEFDAQCIMIDHKDHLYITDNFIITHNTVCALYLALQKFITNGIEKIIIVRSAIPTRNQGFLPGTLEEKEEVYSAPYKSLVNNLFHNDTAWEILTKRGYIQFITTSYIRGLTFENCVVIFDELQNTDVDECYTILTRLGKDCRIIICGDFKQDDIKRKREFSSFNWLIKVIRLVPEYFRIIEFTHDDIVRSDLVKRIIIAAEKVDESF